MELSKFFNEDYCNFGAYDGYRKIANYIDGFKPSARKVMHTAMKTVRDDIKVSILQSRTAEKTGYLHGEASLYGVVVGLAQDFVGTNNIPLLKREGHFGTRAEQDPAASRYIFTNCETVLPYIFREEDEAILKDQIFEGDHIEPQYFYPIIPLLLVNGSEGVAVGFAQKILPRNPIDIIKAIKYRLTSTGRDCKTYSIPYFKGFKGTVVETEPGSYEIKGTFERVHSTKIKITEIPIGYDLSSYLKVLDRLEDDGKIKYYTDMSSDESFCFEVHLQRADLETLTDDEIMQMFKLIKRVTENYTCIDEDNKIREFKSIDEVLDAYGKARIQAYAERKAWLLSRLETDIKTLHSKYLFVKNVIEKNIILDNKSEENVESQLEKINGIIKIDGSFNYLLNMPMRSLTKETYQKLKEQIKEKAEQLKTTKATSQFDLWMKDLEELERKLK